MKSIMKYIIVLLVLCVVIVFSVLLVNRKTSVPNKGGNEPEPEYIYRESSYPEEVYGVPVTTQLVDVNGLSRVGEKRIIKYIVIHETDNYSKGANASNHAHYLTYNNQTSTSWHYTVDDHEIYHHIPDDEIAHHAGDVTGNLYGIGIELCVNKDGNFNTTFENGAKLVAYLLKEYQLPVDNIKMHRDFSGKDCPHSIIKKNSFDYFKKRVQYYLGTDL